MKEQERFVPNLYFIDEAVIQVKSAQTSSLEIVNKDAYRKLLYIYNDSQSTLYIKFGENCSSNDFSFKMDPYSFFESVKMPCYRGKISGMWETATGSARVTNFF